MCFAFVTQLMVVIFSVRTHVMIHWHYVGKAGGGVKALESDFTHVAMAADCNHPKHNHIVTSVCMLCTNNHNLAAQTHTNTHNWIYCFSLITAIRLFQLLLQRKRFQDKGMLVLAIEGKIAGGPNECSSLLKWKRWSRKGGGGSLQKVGWQWGISRRSKFISYYLLLLVCSCWWLRFSQWLQWVKVICFFSRSHRLLTGRTLQRESIRLVLIFSAMQAVCTIGIVDVWDRGMCKHPCEPSNEPSSMAVQWLALALGSTPVLVMCRVCMFSPCLKSW